MGSEMCIRDRRVVVLRLGAAIVIDQVAGQRMRAEKPCHHIVAAEQQRRRAVTGHHLLRAAGFRQRPVGADHECRPFCAQRVDQLIEDAQLDIAGISLEVIALPGHSLQQVGIVHDGVCFAADGFFGPAVLAKHGIPYAQDVDEQRATLEYLRGRSEQYFLPGYGDLSSRAELSEALNANLTAINLAAEAVYAALESPVDLPAVAAYVRRALKLNMTGVPQYAIFLSVIAAHLTALERAGKAAPYLDDHGIIWSRK